jgi:6-pyruvoyltetrahydropterin/6-carboxytetrahydropterin synthase
MLHGHRYALEASFAAKKLDDLGRVIDFGIVRELLGSWIDEHFDHNTILSIKDKKLGEKIAAETGQKIFYLDENPTAENIAKFLFEKICPKIFAKKNVKCVAIKLYETPNCYVSLS